MDEARQILNALGAPFRADEVDWRVGKVAKDNRSGLALAYIDARTVADRFDSVLGLNWRCSYPTISRSGGSLVVCLIEVKIGNEWIGRANGAGDTAIEGVKGGLSDGFKRAATMFGVGRYLYGFPSPWVALDQYKAIEKGEWPRLHKIAADALAAYLRDPAGFRPPPPDAPPERPGFTPAAAPARPEPPPRPAAPASVSAPLPSALPVYNVAHFASASILRAHLDAKKPVDGTVYVAAARTLLGAATSTAEVNDIVACLKSHAPPTGHGLNRDVEAARARVAQGAQP